ncbi:MAG: GAF domain-containing protein [Ignavibacteriales bacterium]|nr:MAG: GAF domain-containing protein [Ignavibacteriales bacterium]
MEKKDQTIKELLLLQRVAQKINSILDLNLLLEEIVGDVAETFGYLRSGVLLKDNKTNELEIAAVKGWTKNFHVKGDRFKIGEYGMVGHVAQTGDTYYAPDVTLDPYYQVSEDSTRSEVDIPLKVNGELIGVFNIQHQEKNAFEPERIKLLESLAHHIAIAIENARLFQKERFEKERMLRELNDARSIQSKLFPKESPDVEGFKITGICLPCLEVGGDWYDFIPLNDGRLGIVLADVSGKGMGAALLMSSTRSLLRLVAGIKHSPGEVLQQLNEILIKDLPSARFVTMVYAILNPGKGTLVFSNAGHLKPVLKNSSGIKFLETTDGMPLGITEGTFSESEIQLSPGSKIVFYSDGVTEAMNYLSEEYGDEKLIKHLSEQNATIESVINNVREFTKGTQPFDDITVLMIEAK